MVKPVAANTSASDVLWVVPSDVSPPTFQVAGGGAIVREGGDTSEGTTQSTSDAEVLAATGLTIAAIQPVYFTHGCRKDAGGSGHDAGSGIRINATTIASPSTGGNFRPWGCTNTDRAETGGVHVWIGPRVTNYLTNIMAFFRASLDADPASNVNGSNAVAVDCTSNSRIPNAEITDVDILMEVSNTALLAGSDELQVYSLASS